jgi:hypothetical protein
MIPLTPIVSSMIHSIGYDNASRTLAVRFNNSDLVHHFKDVGVDTATRVQIAPSIGRAFNEHIRGQYDHTTVQAGDEAPTEDGIVTATDGRRAIDEEPNT